MLIRLISDLAQDKDDVKQRLDEDIEPVFEAYGITELEREVLQSRDVDRVRALVEEELDACLAVVASPEGRPAPKGPGAAPSAVEAQAVLDAYGITIEDLQALKAVHARIRIQAITQIEERIKGVMAIPLAAPAPWPPKARPSGPLVVNITPTEASVGWVEVTVTRGPGGGTAPSDQDPKKYTLSFRHSNDDTVVTARSTGADETMERIVREAEFQVVGVYDVLITPPSGQTVVVRAAGIEINANRRAEQR